MSPEAQRLKLGCLSFAVLGCAIIIGGTWRWLGIGSVVPAAALGLLAWWLTREVPVSGHGQAKQVPTPSSAADELRDEVAAIRALGARSQSRSPPPLNARGKPAPATRERQGPTFDLGPALRSGKSQLTFTYVDTNGVVTERQVGPWTEYLDHISGYCHSARGDRTFRKDRIDAWHHGSEEELAAP